MNLLVWLLFLVGTWPVVRWALQSRSHDMQKKLWKLSLDLPRAAMTVIVSRQVCAQQMSDPRPRCPVCRRRSELEHLEGWRVGRVASLEIQSQRGCFP